MQQLKARSARSSCQQRGHSRHYRQAQALLHPRSYRQTIRPTQQQQLEAPTQLLLLPLWAGTPTAMPLAAAWKQVLFARQRVSGPEAVSRAPPCTSSRVQPAPPARRARTHRGKGNRFRAPVVLEVRSGVDRDSESECHNTRSSRNFSIEKGPVVIEQRDPRARDTPTARRRWRRAARPAVARTPERTAAPCPPRNGGAWMEGC